MDTHHGPAEIHRAVGTVSSFGGSPVRQEIGLGRAIQIVKIEVDWPNSRSTHTVSNVPLEGEDNLYWEHPNHKHSIRIVTEGDTVIGINVMGLRYRHKVCEGWIKEQKSVSYVLDNLHEANFDPEFYDKFELDIKRSMKEKAA